MLKVTEAEAGETMFCEVRCLLREEFCEDWIL